MVSLAEHHQHSAYERTVFVYFEPIFGTMWMSSCFFRSFNTRTGNGLIITALERGGGRVCLPAISAPIRARITKLGRPERHASEFYGVQFW